MKRILVVSFVLCLLCGCRGSTEMPGGGDSTVADNPNPIPALKEISFGDVDAVLSWEEGSAEDKMYPLDDEDLEEAFFNRLKQVRLTGRPDAKVKLVPTLKYDVRLTSGESIHIGFAGLYVEFGDGVYAYENCDKTLFPEDIRRIGFDNADGQYYYEDAADIEALRRFLTPTPYNDCTDYKGDGVRLFFSVLSRGAPLAESYVIEIVDVPICLYKSFFTLKTCYGVIGCDGYTQLEIAKNGQFGTRLQLTVTSGGRTIYPAPHFVCSATYSAASGSMVAGDAFPRFEDYGLAEALTLADDFSIWIRESDAARYKITRDGVSMGEGGALTDTAFEGLAPGIYQVAVFVTKHGRYVEELKEYESSTDVYYFLVIVD